MSSGARVLVIGLDPQRVLGPWDPKPIADAIEAGMAQLAGQGFRAQTCLIALDGTDDIEAVVASALREQEWDCVIVGGGLRKDEALLATFEALVNLVHRHAPQAAIAFNSTPDGLAEAVTRHLPATGAP